MTAAADKPRGLGRGLNALFGDDEGETPGAAPASDTRPAAETDTRTSDGRRVISTAQIVPGKFQPRHIFDDKSIAELADSIEQHGLLQPILVREIGNATSEIIAGERRWRAAQKAQLHQVPVIIKEISDKEALELGLIENLQREDLNPIDESRALKQMIDTFNYSQEQVAEKVGKSRPYVSNMLRLSELAPEIAGMVEDGELSAGHARALLGLDNKFQVVLAKKIIAGHMNVRQAEKLASAEKGTLAKNKVGSAMDSLGKKIQKGAAEKDINTLSLEREISNVVGMTVSIDMLDAQAGSLTIQFKNLDQLDEVLHRLSHNPGRLAVKG